MKFIKSKNANVNYLAKIVEITIKRPQRKVKQRKLFTFLDEEEEN